MPGKDLRGEQERRRSSVLPTHAAPSSQRAAGPGGPGADAPPLLRRHERLGAVDYRMARLDLVNQFKAGRLAQHEVCDAHPELRRAAEHLGRATTQVCPICEDAVLVHVTYAFGPHLPKSGYVIEDRADLKKVKRTTTDGTGYVVEVCAACGWNFMAQSFPIEGRRRA